MPDATSPAISAEAVELAIIGFYDDTSNGLRARMRAALQAAAPALPVTVNGYALGRIVLDLYDAGALHARCTTCSTEQAFAGDEEDPGGPHGPCVALDRVTEWAAGHVKTCPGSRPRLRETTGGPLIGDRRCDNCHQPLREHCTVHLVPCCPGRCPGPNR